MKINDRRFIPIEPVEKLRQAPKTGQLTKKSPTDFADLLKQELGKDKPIKMSAHAEQRLKERNITLTKEDLERMQDAFDVLAEKGGRNSVVFYKSSAFVASVPNRTVITAMDLDEDMQVITNIDSAVHVK